MGHRGSAYLQNLDQSHMDSSRTIHIGKGGRVTGTGLDTSIISGRVITNYQGSRMERKKDFRGSVYNHGIPKS